MSFKVHEKLTRVQKESVRAFARAVKSQSIQEVEFPMGRGGWKPKSGLGFWIDVDYRIKPAPPEVDYAAGHAECGLKVGDLVRVTRAAVSWERGWAGAWVKAMDAEIDEVSEITWDKMKGGFELEYGFCFPYFVLEKVELTYRPWTPLEAIGKIVKRKGGSTLRTIVSCDEVGWVFGNTPIPFLDLLLRYEQSDGSPCGVLVEGGEA